MTDDAKVFIFVVVLQVNPSSVAESAGIQPGDSILKIGQEDTGSFSHKDAQDSIIRSGNYLEMTIQRYSTRDFRKQLFSLLYQIARVGTGSGGGAGATCSPKNLVKG